MSKAIFDDAFSRKMLRLLIFIELGVVVLVLGLIWAKLYSLALTISCCTFFAFLFLILGLYIRYRKNPLVQEKRDLSQRSFNLQTSIHKEEIQIQSVKQKRDHLIKAQQNETTELLSKFQQEYIQQGLAKNSIADATIPGVGPKLKERLYSHSINTAADIGSNIYSIPGFGEAKQQSLVNWRNTIFSSFDATKPIKLTDEQMEGFRRKYEALHDENELVGERSQVNKQKLENELNAITPRLDQLASVKFTTYLSQSLASRGIGAVFLALMLVIAQMISSGSAMTSSIIASIPTTTVTSTETLTPINTFTPTITMTPTVTITSTITDTPSSTNTLEPTITLVLTPTSNQSALGASCIPDNTPQTGKVVDVVDGDTIKVLLDQDGQTYTVRYIGIDAPEYTSQVEYFGAEATAKNGQLVFGKTITLIKDVSEKDIYGRLLRYILVDNTFINYELVAQGYANTASFPPDIACIPAFQEAEQKASSAKIGLWNASPTLVVVPATSGASSGGNAPCSCNGPDLNCTDFSTHSSAQACFTYCQSQGFGDVFRLDGDGNGLACESLP